MDLKLTTSNDSISCPATAKFAIGGAERFNGGMETNSWKGYISELIVFDKPLSGRDRKSVEQYLGQKYNIVVSQ
ncbi:MAG: hypothetical protein KGQ36_02840 [Rickettsiales bacterium]|nr:hypothetical protein [Rickettsiales bacterium]